tara:strand:+ start:225 stop:389 length:165 start_codon:yes stop_codon:yes gene_type:complete
VSRGFFVVFFCYKRAKNKKKANNTCSIVEILKIITGADIMKKNGGGGVRNGNIN